MPHVFDASPSRHAELSTWLFQQWEALEDGQARLAYPPGEQFWSGLHRSGNTLRVDPGGFRHSFIVQCEHQEARIVAVLSFD